MKKDIALVHFEKGVWFPTNLLYLIPHLEDKGISFSVIEYNDCDLFYKDEKDRFKIQYLFSFLSNIKEEIIAISCMQDILPKLILALIDLKPKFPGKKIILGGNGPNNSAKSIIEKFGHIIDFIVVGVGDFVLPKLVRKILENESNFEDLPGICFKKANKVVYSPPAFLPNYFEIKDKIPIEDMGFNYFNVKRYNYFPLITSKGCPYQCSFCSLNHHFNFARKLYYGDIKKTVQMISYLNSKSAKLRFFVVDEAFICNKKRLDAFCDSVKKEKNNPKLSLYGRVNLMNENLMKSLSSSGFDAIYYGIESGSNDVLRKINKGFDIKDAIKVVLKSDEYFDCVTASLIWGFPFESMKDFMDSMLLFLYFRAKNIFPQFHLLAPFKNSPLYLQYSDKLRFDANLVSDFASTDLRNNNSEELKKVINLIKNNKEIFSYYFYYYDPNIKQKKVYYDKLNLFGEHKKNNRKII